MKRVWEFLRQGLFYPFRLIWGRLETEERGVGSIGMGVGEVVEIEGKKMAVYKDEQGQIYKMSPVCTHLACYVEWQKGEW